MVQTCRGGGKINKKQVQSHKTWGWNPPKNGLKPTRRHQICSIEGDKMVAKPWLGDLQLSPPLAESSSNGILADHSTWISPCKRGLMSKSCLCEKHVVKMRNGRAEWNHVWGINPVALVITGATWCQHYYFYLATFCPQNALSSSQCTSYPRSCLRMFKCCA